MSTYPSNISAASSSNTGWYRCPRGRCAPWRGGVERAGDFGGRFLGVQADEAARRGSCLGWAVRRGRRVETRRRGGRVVHHRAATGLRPTGFADAKWSCAVGAAMIALAVTPSLLHHLVERGSRASDILSNRGAARRSGDAHAPVSAPCRRYVRQAREPRRTDFDRRWCRAGHFVDVRQELDWRAGIAHQDHAGAPRTLPSGDPRRLVVAPNGWHKPAHLSISQTGREDVPGARTSSRCRSPRAGGAFEVNSTTGVDPRSMGRTAPTSVPLAPNGAVAPASASPPDIRGRPRGEVRRATIPAMANNDDVGLVSGLGCVGRADQQAGLDLGDLVRSSVPLHDGRRRTRIRCADLLGMASGFPAS